MGRPRRSKAPGEETGCFQGGPDSAELHGSPDPARGSGSACCHSTRGTATPHERGERKSERAPGVTAALLRLSHLPLACLGQEGRVLRSRPWIYRRGLGVKDLEASRSRVRRSHGWLDLTLARVRDAVMPGPSSWNATLVGANMVKGPTPPKSRDIER